MFVDKVVPQNIELLVKLSYVTADSVGDKINPAWSMISVALAKE